jgi:uncharacterized membrane protein YbhN (UPF0104 family)
VFAGSRRRAYAMFFVVIAGVAVLYLCSPACRLGETGRVIERGDPWWLALALACTIASFGGYVAVFRGVFAGHASRLDWRASYQITMAGLAARGCSARAAPAASR